MSRLTVVRHGQASFFSSNYDELSTLGWEQSVLLGEYFASWNLRFDAVVLGPRQRHRQTFDGMREGYLVNGHSLPEPLVLPGFDEHHVDQCLRSSPMEEQGSLSDEERMRAFQKHFEGLCRDWLAGELTEPKIESWSEFSHRVNRAIEQVLISVGRGSEVLVVSSAGTMGVILQRAVGCSAEAALELGWRNYNSSVSRYLFSADRFTLDSFNGTGHLGEKRLLTYR